MSLEEIKEKLKKCYKDRQPVLLHGRDDYGREKLVKEIHKDNMGIDRDWIYEGKKSTKKRIDSMREELRKLLTDKLLGDIKRNKLYEDYKDLFNKYMLDCKDTIRTYKYEDCIRKSGKEVLYYLSCFEYKRIDSGGEFKYDLLEVGSHIWRNHSDRCLFKKQHERSDTKELLRYKGVFYIDKLRCADGNTEDKRGYEELADKIISLLEEVPKSERGWLVLYVRNRSTFPPEFFDPFKSGGLVSLDKRDYEAEKQKEASGNDKDITTNILFMDVKKKALYFDKNKLVTLKPEEMNLIEYLCKHDAFELEQILTEHFEINLTETYKHSNNIVETLSLNTKPSIGEQSRAISKGERNIFDTYKSNINNKCKTLEIGDLIVKHGDIKKVFKLSAKITKKTLQL